MKNSVSKMFDAISPSYDRVNRIVSLGLDLRWRRSLADHLPHAGPLDLLDLATGTGDQIAALLECKVPLRSVVGIDLSSGMLALAKKKFPQIDFLEANAEALPFSDASFDLCTFSFGIRNVQNPLAALREMRRVTKPDGRCLILEFSLPKGWFRIPYLFYARHLLPFLGGLLSGNRSAYRYLNQSIERFAQPEIFLSWMRETGWTHCVAEPLLFGAVTLYRGNLASSVA